MIIKRRKINVANQKKDGAHPHERSMLLHKFYFSKYQEIQDNSKKSAPSFVDFFDPNVAPGWFQMFGITNNASTVINVMSKIKKLGPNTHTKTRVHPQLDS